MDYLKKNAYWIMCTQVLLVIVVLGFVSIEKERVHFVVSTPNGTEKICIYYADDGNGYLFLPSYAELDQISAVVPDGVDASLGNVILSDGMNLGEFQFETAYEFDETGRKQTTIWLYRSSHVASMHITTLSGSMDRIHENKDYEETASVAVYSPDGERVCYDQRSNMQGRGNTTWTCEKKPYRITLSVPSALLGMRTATDWLLISNYFDSTNLRNKIVLDYAARICTQPTVQCEYVDVYLNGEYNGLYLLAESITQENGFLGLNTAEGDFLCATDFETRWDIMSNPFISSGGRSIEINIPAAMTDTEKRAIETNVALMEERIASGEDLSVDPQFDLDSWVCKYLIDEIFGNIDADLSSNYFFSKDGVFYGGPVWDYDVAMGNTNVTGDPASFYAKQFVKYSGYTAPYYDALYRNQSFYQRLIQIYADVCSPLLKELTQIKINEMATSIKSAAVMNGLRWGQGMLPGGEEETVYASFCDSLISYLNQRKAFLDRAWIEGVDYCTVQLNPSYFSECYGISVEKGSVLNVENLDFATIHWIDRQTGEPFDPSQPINDDMILISHSEERVPVKVDDTLLSDKRVLVSFASLGALGVLFVIFAVINYCRTGDFKRRNK